MNSLIFFCVLSESNKSGKRKHINHLLPDYYHCIFIVTLFVKHFIHYFLVNRNALKLKSAPSK